MWPCGVVCSAQEAVRFKQVFGQESNWLRRAFVRRGVMLVTSAAYDARTGVGGWC